MNEASDVVNLPAIPSPNREELYEVFAKAMKDVMAQNVPEKPILSGIDKLLGGNSLVGLKTLLGGLGALGTVGAQSLGVVDSDALYTALVLGFSALGGAGLLAKIDRFVIATTQVAQFVTKEGPKLSAAIEKGVRQ